MDTKLSKVKRRTWSTSAVELFFEGLYQYGKDFFKILELMQSKQKKSNVSIPPGLTYDQVRYYYYRTWHKVELLLTDPSCVEKRNATKQSNVVNEESGGQQVEATVEGPSEDEVQLDSSLEEVEDSSSKPLSPKKSLEESTEEMAQNRVVDKNVETFIGSTVEIPATDKTEKRKDVITINGIQHSLDLVALICYWKLKKKHPVGDRSFARRLSELVYTGATTIPARLKGKRRTQLKIPVCGALRQNCTSSSEKVQVDPPEVKNVTPQGEPNREESDNDVTNISAAPALISVELVPLTLSSWQHLQSKAFNPRLRVSIDSSKSVEDLQNFLANRFSVSGLKLQFSKGHDLFKDSYFTGECGTNMDHLSSDFNVTETLSDLYLKCTSGVLRLSYEIVDHSKMDEQQNLANLFKLAQFLKPKMQDKQKPVGLSMKAFSSPKVAEYLRTLPLGGVRKSPASKYKKIRSQASKRDGAKPEGESTDAQVTRVEMKDVRPAVIASNYCKANIRKSKPKLLNQPRVLRQLVPKPLTFLPEVNHKKPEDSTARKTLDFSLFEKLQPSTVSISDRATLLQGPTVRIAPAPNKAPVSTEPSLVVRPGCGSAQLAYTEAPSLPVLDKSVTVPVNDSACCSQEHIPSDHIQSTVLSQYLLNPPSEVQQDDQPQFSSSDTVNELLKGFAAPSPKESIHILSLETEDVLPTFSQVLKQCSIPDETDQQNVCETDQQNIRDSEEEKNSPPLKSKEPEVMDCTAVFDDGTTDYIRRFQELASNMEKGCQDS